MAVNNANLHAAREAGDDEFYTRIEDIENELKHYRKYFKNKTVFCNCDDPQWSNFWKYFEANFEFLGLKKLISTHYEPSDLFESAPSYKRVIERDANGKAKKPKNTPLKGNGSFSSQECVALLKEANIVISNPPFSLFREYISQLIQHDKKFIVIGPHNAITYKEIFPLIRDNKLWLGVTSVKQFVQPDGNIKKFGNIGWYTNIDHKKRKEEELLLLKKYKEFNYPKYDNYDAIEVSHVEDIPCDYDGIMGVPINFLNKFNPNQFEIIGSNRGVDQDKNQIYGRGSFINGKETFKRLFIRHKTVK